MIVWEACKPENKLYHLFYFCCVIQGQHSLISPRGPDPPKTDSSLTSHDFVIWTSLLSCSFCQFIYILSIKLFSASVSPIHFHCLHGGKTLFYVCHKDLKLQVQNLSSSFKPQLYKRTLTPVWRWMFLYSLVLVTLHSWSSKTIFKFKIISLMHLQNNHNFSSWDILIYLYVTWMKSSFNFHQESTMKTF